jgi:hypothetical protein
MKNHIYFTTMHFTTARAQNMIQDGFFSNEMIQDGFFSNEMIQDCLFSNGMLQDGFFNNEMIQDGFFNWFFFLRLLWLKWKVEPVVCCATALMYSAIIVLLCRL